MTNPMSCDLTDVDYLKPMGGRIVHDNRRSKIRLPVRVEKPLLQHGETVHRPTKNGSRQPKRTFALGDLVLMVVTAATGQLPLCSVEHLQAPTTQNLECLLYMYKSVNVALSSESNGRVPTKKKKSSKRKRSGPNKRKHELPALNPAERAQFRAGEFWTYE